MVMGHTCWINGTPILSVIGQSEQESKTSPMPKKSSDNSNDRPSTRSPSYLITRHTWWPDTAPHEIFVTDGSYHGVPLRKLRVMVNNGRTIEGLAITYGIDFFTMAEAVMLSMWAHGDDNADR